MNKNSANVEHVTNAEGKIFSPLPRKLNDIYFACENGEIFRFKDGIMKPEFKVDGHPSGITMDHLGKKCFIADKGHQAIFMKDLEDKTNIIHDMANDFEGEPFIGPHSIVIDNKANLLYFTDAGPWGETSIENPQGSVFVINIEAGIIRPLALNCLAFPSGLALAHQDQVLYVCETARNRILRFLVSDNQFFNFSVFFQFSGRFGPTAIAIHGTGNLYVSHYEYKNISRDGEILVINPKGELIGHVNIPEYPEIIGMAFVKTNYKILFVTENSKDPVCVRVLIDNETFNKTNKDVNQLDSFK